MMRKYVSRLLALVLVLCMVVLCVPVRARADVDMTRPDGLTDEQWKVELEKRRALALKQALEAETKEQDTLSSSNGNLTVTDQATIPTTPPADTPAEAKSQDVTVELPVEAGEISSDKTVSSYETSEDGTTVTEDVSLDLDAKITEIQTDSTQTDPDKKVTDITYDISLDGAVIDTTKAPDGTTTTPTKAEVTEDVDVEMNKDAAPQETAKFKVDMSINGMDEKKVTRVTHKYTTPKETTAPDETPAEETHEEYYYNAANGTEDTTKKYFTITEVETEKAGVGGTLEKVKEKVVSLWTGFLGIFHITTDAFEGAADADGKKDTYDNLTDAAASEKKVEMLRDYETDSSADLNNKVTVDLNGHDYTNTGDNAAMNVTGGDVTVKNGDIISSGAGAEVSGTGTRFSLKNIFLRSNADNDALGKSAAVSISGSGNTVDVDDSHIDGTRSTYGIQDTSTGKNTVNIDDSVIEGKTGVALKNTDADIRDSYLRSTSGAALSVDGNSKENEVVITNGRFESGKAAANIYAKDKDDIASITVKGGRFTDPTGLYSYIPSGYAAISHNDGSYFLYEVVGTDYIPTRDGYRFLGYTDGNGNAITLAEAARKDVIAYAQWKEIPETAAKESPLIVVKTDEKGCTTKVTIKGDTAYVTVKDKDGEYVPISEVTVTSIKKLQNKGVDTIEVQVDEDVTLVLDIEKAKENGFTDTIEVNLEKDTLLITSGKKTCIELDIAVLKAADKPVEIQLVEGELTVLLGKNSSMSVDLTKALKTGERIVVKLENGVLELYDKYNKPIKD